MKVLSNADLAIALITLVTAILALYYAVWIGGEWLKDKVATWLGIGKHR